MKTIISILLIVASVFAQSQELYMSKPIQKAYENGTRSFEGKPGENYWQNRADYEIEVKIDPLKKAVDGSLLVNYFNESPDTLTKIVMRLYQDFYKKGNNRDFQISPEAVHDGTDIKRVSVRGEELVTSEGTQNIYRSGTNMHISLDEPLNPGEEITVEVEWNFRIPTESTVRLGAYSDTSMFVAYWYPQVAVYDDVDGWDEGSYTGLTEMYNDFSNFKVQITAPKNYVVWATGVLQNPEQVLVEKYLDRYKKANKSETTIKILTLDDKDKEITIGEHSTWVYEAENIPDFAFAIAKNYLWDASTVFLNSGKKVFVDAGYKMGAKNFDRVEYILNEAVKFHSYEMPGVEFPFPAVSVFNGSGGMEFPMMINDGETSTYEGTVGLTMHELAHTYFPFYMGTNERRYAFMDEGWAVFLPVEKQNELGNYDSMQRRYGRYDAQAKSITTVPPMVPSFALDRTSYRMASYTRPGAAYFALQAQLGNEIFLQGLQKFIHRWNGKHPTPYDMFFTFNEVSGQDLNWFWQNWFFDFAVAEMDLLNFEIVDGKKLVTVKNPGGLFTPVILNLYYKDGTEESVIKKPEVWKSGNKEITVELNVEKKITMITLGHENYPNISDKTKLNINE